jgi:uncharacterized Zn-finger protein
MESYPKFHNEIGVPIVRIGYREFKCIGDKPPQDHPHIYLNMGDASEIVCPYCSTARRLDSGERLCASSYAGHGCRKTTNNCVDWPVSPPYARQQN